MCLRSGVDEPWRGQTNKILYVSQFTAVLDDQEADRVAGQIRAGRLGDESLTIWLERLQGALRSTTSITGPIPQPHGEPEVRAFLQRLIARL